MSGCLFEKSLLNALAFIYSLELEISRRKICFKHHERKGGIRMIRRAFSVNEVALHLFSFINKKNATTTNV